MAHYLTSLWASRFQGVRRIPKEDDLKEDDIKQDDSKEDGLNEYEDDTLDRLESEGSYYHKDERSFLPMSDGSFFEVTKESRMAALKRLQSLRMWGLLERDAFERYLFVRQVLHRCSMLWGTLLTAIIVITTLLMIYAYFDALYYFTKYETILYSDAMLLVVGATVALFIILSLMHANSAVDCILDGFQFSASADYQIIGKRDDWVAYVKDSPVYWYIFGFAITRGWLFGFVGGIITTIGTGLILAFFGM